MHRVICAAPDEVGSSAGMPMPMPSRCPPRACSNLRAIHCIAIRSTCSHSTGSQSGRRRNAAATLQRIRRSMSRLSRSNRHHYRM
eukprot:scaffold4505_cov103-Isochrysis_galbana.AAC.3